jgi:hypothetical protein
VLLGSLKIQWGIGSVSAVSGSGNTITFPTAYSTTPLAVVITTIGASAGGATVIYTSGWTATKFDVYRGNVSNIEPHSQFTWLSIGY